VSLKSSALQKTLKKGPWEFSPILRDLQVAHFWRLTPAGFWNCVYEDQAMMIAFVEAQSEMRQIEEKMISKK